MTELQMRAVIRDLVKEVGSLRAAAKKWKCSAAYLSDVLNGRRAPGPRVLEPIGYGPARSGDVPAERVTARRGRA
jgi:hypothetical protein